MASGCCGQPLRPRPRVRAAPALPSNPGVSRGVRLLYLGSGYRKLRGAETGLAYYVSDHRRPFTADARDASALLRLREVILAP